jgi:hypothetical protein
MLATQTCSDGKKNNTMNMYSMQNYSFLTMAIVWVSCMTCLAL